MRAFRQLHRTAARAASLAALVFLATSPAVAVPRDPTAPPSARAAQVPARPAAPPPVVVSALFLSPDGNRAIVNGQVAVAGGTVRNIQILEITAAGVRYRRGGRVGFAPFGARRLDVKVPVQEKSP